MSKKKDNSFENIGIFSAFAIFGFVGGLGFSQFILNLDNFGLLWGFMGAIIFGTVGFVGTKILN